VNKEKLIDLLKTPSTIDAKSLDEMVKIVSDHPYFQPGYALLAIGNKKLKKELAATSVAKAAIYATDRVLLKAYLDLGSEGDQLVAEQEMEVESKVSENQKTSTADVISKKVDSEPEKVEPSGKGANEVAVDKTESKDKSSTGATTKETPIAQEVAAKEPKSSEGLSSKTTNTPKTQIAPKKYENVDLDKLLSELKDSYQQLQTNMQSFDVADKNLMAAESKKIKTTAEKSVIENSRSEDIASSSESTKKPPGQKATSKGETKKRTNKVSPKSKASPEIDKAIRDDSSSDSALKKKEQKELIDKFIESEPSIRAKKDRNQDSSPMEDLSSKNQVLTDDMVTENLAVIMVKQERSEKAIEVYNKLIWKFPHKKAYFAAQIEELKE